MTEKLTQSQIDKCKILFQRYYKLDKEKHAIRDEIDKILGNYKDTLTVRQSELIGESMQTSDEFIQGVEDDEFPYFLNDHFDELQDEDDEHD